MQISIGDKLRFNGYTHHVRAKVDGHVVLKFWSKEKQRWSYEIQPVFFMEMMEKNGLLKHTKKR